jgi:RNA polymerase sigma-70 factor (ECF subfamily)
MPDRTQEQEWIGFAVQGDDDAFARLVEAYQSPVYNLCYRMLGDGPEAEDAAQESFLKAYQGLGSYDPNRSFTTWLLSIASHHCIDRLRKKRILALSLEDLLPSQEKPDSKPGPEAMVARSEIEESVRNVLYQLADKDRAAIVLRYWYEMSYEEISQTLSLTVSAVKSRLHRARREVAQQWMEQETSLLTTRGRHDEASAL